MKKFAALLVIVSFVFGAKVQAEGIGIITDGIGLPSERNTMNQHISLGGIDAYAYAENEGMRIETYYGGPNGEDVYEKLREEETWGGMSISVDQGCLGGKNVVPFGIDIQVRRSWHEEATLEIVERITFLLLDREVGFKDIKEFDTNIEIDLFGLDIYAGGNLRPQEYWEHDEETDEWNAVRTKNLTGDFSFRMENARTKSLELEIQEYFYSEHEYDPTGLPVWKEWKGFTIEVKSKVQWLGNSSILDTIFPIPSTPKPSSGGGGGFGSSAGFKSLSFQSVPEPTSISLLLLGLVGLLGLRRRVR